MITDKEKNANTSIFNGIYLFKKNPYEKEAGFTIFY